MACRCLWQILLQGGLFESCLINGQTILLSFISQERTLKIWVWLLCEIRCVFYSFIVQQLCISDLFRHRWFFFSVPAGGGQDQDTCQAWKFVKVVPAPLVDFVDLGLPSSCTPKPTRLLQNQPLKAVGKGTHQVSWIETASCEIYFSITVPGTQQVVL